jgi:Domain of unknown function (DUF6285)
MECRRVRDLPTGPALLALARDVLLHELMPLLPQEGHLAARLVANSMAIAEREAVAGEEPAQEILRELEKLYGDGEQGLLLRRLAQDIRAGDFEESQLSERHVREILWLHTITKLRSANPRFLNANGFS